MKKLFVCAMALAAFVSCSKDDVAQAPELDSNNKSVSIKILNAESATRAGTVGGTTAPGVAGACANATDLKILFADADGKVLHEASLTANGTTNDSHTGITEGTNGTYSPEYVPSTSNPNAENPQAETGTYVWHNVPWAVTQIAVVRYEAGDLPDDATSAIGLDLETDIEGMASKEEINIDRGVDDIILYASAKLEDKGRTHRVGDVVYHLWEAGVTVAPKFARFEIINFACTDLGNANEDVDKDGKPILSTYGFDELVVNGLTWNNTYTAKDFNFTLYGSYVPETPTTGFDYAEDTPTAEADRPNAKVATNVAWSWNVLPTTFSNLVVNMEAKAYDYTIAPERRSVPLHVTGLASTKANATAGNDDANAFAAKNIYKLDLSFTESNIIDPEGLCVEVKVTIEPWTVKTVFPVFGAPGSANAQ